MSREGDQPLPISRFDYHLPSELIAQHPIEPRDASRLLLVDRERQRLEDRVFHELPDILSPGDMLVLNDSRVIPARLFARRVTGGLVELLMLECVEGDYWKALGRPLRRLRPGENLTVVDVEGEATDALVEISEKSDDGSLLVRIDGSRDVLKSYGQMPLPPYIGEKLEDPDRYQTVYSEREGSAAAPTAGLHFTQNLLDRCVAAGVQVEHITLHVGLDTFQPVKVEDARQHQIHSEWFEVGASTHARLRSTFEQGRRIVAVGTTVARTLETIASQSDVERLSGTTSIYITPPHTFKMVDALLTNFHLPRTTLLLMVSAFAGEELVRQAYSHAIENRYRFYSFGDAMLIV